MNWYKYRLPNEHRVYSGASPYFKQGLDDEGFVVTPFFNEDYGVVMIPHTYDLSEEMVLEPIHSTLFDSTPKDDYIKEVKTLIDYYKKRRGKTVASRCIKIDAEIDLNATFEALCKRFKDAFVFMFSSKATGTWIGASPELLLEEKDDCLSTVALAGTRSAGETEPWDEKNIEEQQMVTEYIVDILKKYCSNVEVSKPFSKNAGNVEHLCSKIKASLPIGSLSDILVRLSPTPALCGSNKHESFNLLTKLERHEHEMYGGFCGPNKINGKTAFYVIVRTARCSDDAVCIYVGGGITGHSNPELEWIETEMKSKTIINNIITKSN